MTLPKLPIPIIFDGWGHRALIFLFLSLILSQMAQSQMPAHFHWVDFKQEPSMVSKIEQALKAEHYTAIREIGVKDGFALVAAVKREPRRSTPQGDQWSVYSVSTENLEVKTLLTGYNLQIREWMSFEPSKKPDLGVVYMDCWECEPGSLFTVIHYQPGQGWRARWQDAKDISQPGIPFLITDVGDPYTNEDVDQVFAVFAPYKGVANAGTWYRSQNLATGKVTDTVSNFYVDQQTGSDKSVVLVGPEATKWKLRLCDAHNAVFAIGQTTKACKRILDARGKITK